MWHRCGKRLRRKPKRLTVGQRPTSLLLQFEGVVSVQKVRAMVFLAAIVWMLSLAQYAGANNYGAEGSDCPGEICYVGPNPQDFWFDDDGDGAVPPVWEDSIRFIANNKIDETDINIGYVNLHNNADVAVHHKSWPDANWQGKGFCQTAQGNNRCTHWHLLINTSELPFAYTEDFRRGFACHEGGHTSGLHHADPSRETCMETDTSLPLSHYDGHDRGHINDDV